MKRKCLLLISFVFTISILSGCMRANRQPAVNGQNQTIANKTGYSQTTGYADRTGYTSPNAPVTQRYIDGTYRVSYNRPDLRGWTDFVVITIKKAKITNVVFDASFVKDKHLKSRDASYAAAMKAKVNITPADYQRRLAQQLVNTQDITRVEFVTGASESSQDFVKLAQVALNNAKRGYPKKMAVPSGK